MVQRGQRARRTTTHAARPSTRRAWGDCTCRDRRRRRPRCLRVALDSSPRPTSTPSTHTPVFVEPQPLTQPPPPPHTIPQCHRLAPAPSRGAPLVPLTPLVSSRPHFPIAFRRRRSVTARGRGGHGPVCAFLVHLPPNPLCYPARRPSRPSALCWRGMGRPDRHGHLGRRPRISLATAFPGKGRWQGW